MMYLVRDAFGDALVLQARIDAATGYPHESTAHAVGVEAAADGTRWAVQIAPVWSWTDAAEIDAADLLTEAERDALQTMDALAAEGFWGEA